MRYEDGRRVCFVPEAGEEFFSQDGAQGGRDVAHRLGGPRGGLTDPERYPGTGPYDTGAV
jgi:hypothetical protein